MSSWFVEWESGRTDEVVLAGNRVLRNGNREAWPDPPPKAIVSMIRIPDKVTQFDASRLNATILQDAMSSGFQQGLANIDLAGKQPF